MRRFLFFSPIPFFLFPLILCGQIVPELNGARAAALGRASVTLSDVWSVQNNIGALAIKHPTLAFAYNTRFQLQELTTFGGVFALPVQKGVAAASLSRYGTGAYSIQTAGLGYSHKIRYLTVGIKVNYLQQSVETLGSQGSMVLEAGGKAELFPFLHFAAHAYNITQSKLSKHSKEPVPTLLKAGLEYLPTNDIRLLVQTFKDVDFPSRFSAGLEYQLIEAVKIRTGLLTAPVVASFGLGFFLKSFSFDYAFRHHSTIGAAHHLSIGYSFHDKPVP